MANRPTVGGSDGTWGTELNAHLDVSLDDDGKVDDGAAQTTSAAPGADAELSNKKYVDDEITTLTTYIDTQVATKAMGGYATDDDDSNTMLVAHAYLANQDGFVSVLAQVGPAGGASSIYGYVDTDTNPVSGGTVMAQIFEGIYGQDGDKHFIMFPVASGEYFEVTVSNFDVVSIIWRSNAGTLVKCTDQD